MASALTPMRFSARLAASKGQAALIVDDAPRATRIGYIRGVLANFIRDARSYRSNQEPLDAHETHDAWCALIRDEADPWDYDTNSSWIGLTDHIKACEWPQFYDLVELVGRLLMKKDDDTPFDDPGYFSAYRTQVNALLLEDNIGWSLNSEALLVRQVPNQLAKRAAAVEHSLVDRYATARVHYSKAVQYLVQHPVDIANSIKEMISAIESVARTLDPKAKTLGQAIKTMRKDARHPPHLLSAMENIYSYSNETPLVRHGHSKIGEPTLDEAELVVFTGISFIRYLIATDRPPAGY